MRNYFSFLIGKADSFWKSAINQPRRRADVESGRARFGDSCFGKEFDSGFDTFLTATSGGISNPSHTIKKIILCVLLALPALAFGQEDAGFSDLQWQSDLHEAIEEANVDDKVVIRFDAGNIPDGSPVDIEVWEETDGKRMDFIAGLQGTVVNGSVELEWVVALDLDNKDTNYAREIEENGYAIIDYVFVVKHGSATVSSRPLAILAWLSNLFTDKETGEPMRNNGFAVYGPDGKFIFGETDDEGRAILRNLRKIGDYFISSHLTP